MRLGGGRDGAYSEGRSHVHALPVLVGCLHAALRTPGPAAPAFLLRRGSAPGHFSGGAGRRLLLPKHVRPSP